jgi:hypothetical protein
MSKDADHTEVIINHLLTEVYPVLDCKIDNAIQCSKLAHSKVPEKHLVNDLLIKLKNEFHSLITYEQKLVFPSVLKVFHAKKNQIVPPNLFDLLQLTRKKEEKINHYVLKIALLISNHLWKTQKQEDLVNAFTGSFATEKNVWNKLIQDKIVSYACFKKHNFKNVPLVWLCCWFLT